MKVAIIPARGGSKRIKKKSIKPFLGKPLIAYAIEAALHTGLFEKVIISTDSEEFASVAKEYGASVPFLRPAELAGDFVATAPVVDHAMEWVKKNMGEPDYMCQLYANPFITSENIAKGFDKLTTENGSVVLGVTEFAYPILRAFKINENSNIEYAFPEYKMSRSQDLPNFCHDAAQFYWHNMKPHPDNVGVRALTLPRHMAVDIDTEEDWRIAEKLYQAFMVD